MGDAKVPQPARSDATVGAGESESPPEVEISGRKTDGGQPARTLDERLPVEPPLIWAAEQDKDEAGGAYDPEQVLDELRGYHLHGVPEDVTLRHVSKEWPIPALFTRYKDLSRIRYDYPLCLTDRNGSLPARPLTEIVDEVIAAAADASDEGRRLQRRIYQLEAAVKRLADEEPGARLSALWNRAADEIVASTRLARDEQQMLKQDMTVARGALRVDGEVVPCTSAAASRLFRAAAEADWRRRSENWLQELDGLIAGLREILAADFSHTPEARSPEHLQAAVGEEGAVDYQVMSSLLKQSDLGKPIPDARRRRIEDSLAVLERVRPLYHGEAAPPGSDDEVPLDLRIATNDCASARDRFAKQMRSMAGFFKAVRIARLETENRYQEETHDPFFAGFGVTHLSDEETGLCPPVILALDSGFLSGPGKDAVFDVLTSGIPAKMLVEIDDVLDDRSLASGAELSLGWPARFSSVAVALQDVYVLQAPISNPTLVQSGMRDGFEWTGPAVCLVYTGSRERQPGLSLFHASAAATEARVLPAFSYNPRKSETLAGRTDVSHNPRVDDKWPVETFEFVTATEEGRAVELPFTPADFFFCDVRLSQHYWRVPPEKWHPDMVPLHEFLELDQAAAGSRVPYITAVDPAGEVVRVVPTRAVLNLVRRCQSAWRIVQEWGGVNNSFAAAALSSERKKLKEEKARDAELLRKEYDAELSRNLGDLTHEIIQRIVNQIVSGGVPRAGAPPTEAPAPGAVHRASPTGTVPSEEPEPEEEEPLPFDEPYIDTPLCTSCNECTNLNGSMFVYNENKQAYVKDAAAGTFRELVIAAEKCPVHIVHPGKPKNPDEPGLAELIERAARFN